MPNPVRNISTSMKVTQEQWDEIFGKKRIVGADTASSDISGSMVVVKRKGGKIIYASGEEVMSGDVEFAPLSLPKLDIAKEMEDFKNRLRIVYESFTSR